MLRSSYCLIFQCFFPRQIIQSIKTPIFLVNPAYDFWQVHFSFNNALCISLITLVTYLSVCRYNMSLYLLHQMSLVNGKDADWTFRNVILIKWIYYKVISFFFSFFFWQMPAASLWFMKLFIKQDDSSPNFVRQENF